MFTLPLWLIKFLPYGLLIAGIGLAEYAVYRHGYNTGEADTTEVYRVAEAKRTQKLKDRIELLEQESEVLTERSRKYQEDLKKQTIKVIEKVRTTVVTNSDGTLSDAFVDLWNEISVKPNPSDLP